MATCDTAGVIGPIIHIVASYQATEALKILVGDTDALNPNLEHFDLWNNRHHQIKVANGRRDDCPTCGQRQFSFCSRIRKRAKPSPCAAGIRCKSPLAGNMSLDLDVVAERLSPLGQVERNKFLLRFHVDPHTLVVFPDGRVLVQGTDDVSLARTLHARYIGA